MFSGEVNSYSQAKGLGWFGLIELAAGQTIDFAVGYGTNKTYNYDNTGLDVTVSKLEASVPEPSTLAGISLGFSMLAALRRKSRRRSAKP